MPRTHVQTLGTNATPGRFSVVTSAPSTAVRAGPDLSAFCAL